MNSQDSEAGQPASSLFRTIMIYVIALVTLVACAVNLLNYLYSVSEEETLYHHKLAVYSEYLGESLEWPLWNIDLELVAKTGAAFSANTEIATLVVRDEQQQIVYQYQAKAESKFRHVVVIKHNGKNIGSAEIGLTSVELQKKNRQLLISSGLNTLLLIAVLLIALRWILSRLFQKPLSTLSSAINDVVQGDYQQSLPAASHVEFQPILSNFKLMTDTVASREKSLRNTNQLLAGEVAERKLAEKKLFENSKLLEAIIENIPNMIFLKEAADLRFKLFNRAGEQLLGQERRDIIGRNDYDFFPEAQADFFTAKDREVLQRHDILDIAEESIETPQGTRILHTKKLALCDEQGLPQYLLGISEDITERKQSELQLRFSENLLRQSQSVAKIGSWRLDVARDELIWSDETYRMFGIPVGSPLSQQDFMALVHPDDRKLVDTAWQAALGGAPYLVEHRILVDGQVRWMEERAELELNAEGNLSAGIGSVQDITERKASEVSLQKLSQAVEQTPSCVVITNLKGNIEYANAAYREVTGYSYAEVIGKNLSFLKSGKTAEPIYREMWAQLARGEIWKGELINRRKDGCEYIAATQISPVRQVNGEVSHYLGVQEDVTEKKQILARMESLAHFDQLTGLPNRTLLADRSSSAMSMAQRNEHQLVVMFIDLDHFKDINDTLGHSAGDLLLIEIARRIKSLLRAEDTVARMGGDEFILILPDTGADGAMRVATKLVETISLPCSIEGHDLISTPSIGIAIYPNDGTNFEVLSKNADAAMYQAKQGGRCNFRFYTAEMQVNSGRNLLLANAMRHALARGEFELHYQPQLSIQGGHVVGAEALLRWQHPELGMISPGEFIPIAEDSGQIIPIGEWVVRTAAQQLKTWMDSGLPAMMMAVNLSAVQFRQANIATLITDILNEVGLPHEYLEVELTEAVAMDNPHSAIAVMDSLDAQGIRMSIDDFGTGYSSLSYLKKFKVYKLKIDQSFVRDIAKDPEDKAIVTAIISLASSLGLKTIAEGVETADQLAFLRLQGCNEVQGYYFSKPLPVEQFEIFLANNGQ